MITTATPSMIPILKSLWIEAFKDSEDYVDFFFNHRFNDVATFVYLVDDNPVSMAFVFNEELYHKGAYIHAGYIYGVATSSKHQGRGYSTEVLKHIQSIYPTTFLIPATKRLFDFYGRGGYQTAFIVHEETLSITDHCLSTASYSFDAISSAQYRNIRDRYFQREGYIRWSEASIAYAIAENKFCGGSASKVTLLDHHIQNNNTPEDNISNPNTRDDSTSNHSGDKSNHQDIILYRCYNNQLYIKETTLSGQSLYDVAILLMKENHVTTCHLRLARGSSSPGRGFGMLHSSFSVENGYCNLVLD